MQIFRYFKIIKTVIFFSVFFYSLYSQATCQLSSHISVKTPVSSHCMEYFIENSNKTALEEIQKKHFQNFPAKAPIIPNTEGAIWVRYSLSQSDKEKEIFIGFERTFMDLTVYVLKSSKIFFKDQINWKTHIRTKNKNKSKIGTKILLPANSPIEIYLKINTRYIPNLTHYLYHDEIQFLDDVSNISLFHFFAWGFIIAFSILNLILSRNPDLQYLAFAGIFLSLISFWSINLDHKIYVPDLMDFESFSSILQFLSQFFQILYCRSLFKLKNIRFLNLYSRFLLSLIVVYLFTGLFIAQDFHPKYGLIFFALINSLTIPFLFIRAKDKFTPIDRTAYTFLLLGYLTRILGSNFPLFYFLKPYVAYAPLYGMLIFSLLTLISVFFKMKEIIQKMISLENLRINFNLVKQKEMNKSLKYVIHEFKGYFFELQKFFQQRKDLIIAAESPASITFDKMLTNANILVKNELLDYRDGHNLLTACEIQNFLESRIEMSLATIEFKLEYDESFEFDKNLNMTNIDFKNIVKPLLNNSLQSIDQVKEGKVFILIKMLEDQVIKIEIKDNGIKLPTELLNKKHKQKPVLLSLQGTGVGLSQVCEIMEKYDGVLCFKRNNGWNQASVIFKED